MAYLVESQQLNAFETDWKLYFTILIFEEPKHYGPMRMKWRFPLFPSLLILICLCACEEEIEFMDEPEPNMVLGAFIDGWTYRIFPNAGSNFDVAEFRLWVPDSSDISEIRAIQILASSYNSNGLGLAQANAWQEFAIEHDLGLLSVHFKSFNPASFYESYSNANDGSGAALLTAFKAVCEYREMEELLELPFLLRGYSAGGMFSYSFSIFRPKRVLAFADIRGWIIASSSKDNKDIPGLFLLGEYDRAESNLVIKNAVKNNRLIQGPWCYAVEPGVDHFGGLEKSDKLIRNFFSACIEQRLQEGTSELQLIPIHSGWLGNNESLETFSYDEYPGEKNAASWLINEEFALKWQEFQLP
jgi:hypothetical protein